MELWFHGRIKTIHNRENSEFIQHLTGPHRKRKADLIIVPTNSLKSALEKRSNNANLFITPESLDYRLRFRTSAILAFSEIKLMGKNILDDPSRGFRLNFALLRTKLYNPIVKISVYDFENMDFFIEKVLSVKFVPYFKFKEWEHNSVVFFTVSTRRDIPYWYDLLREKVHCKPVVICRSLPNNLQMKLMKKVRQNNSIIITTKSVALSLCSKNEKIVTLPRLSDSKSGKSPFDVHDISLLLAHEKRINNVSSISRVVTQLYGITNIQIKSILNSLIGLGILYKFKNGTVAPTLLGKTIVRNFLTMKTSLGVLLKADTLVTLDEVNEFLLESPEFFHERLLLEQIQTYNSFSEIVRDVIEFDVINQKIWLLKGMYELLRVTRKSKSQRLIGTVLMKLKNRKKELTGNFRKWIHEI